MAAQGRGGGGTISSLLGELDLISGAAAPAGAQAGGGIAFSVASASLLTQSGSGQQQKQQDRSAISVLREHRELEKQRQLQAASIVLPPSPVVRSNPLLDQIGASTTEPPTYWKTPGASSASHKKYSSSATAGKHVSKAVKKKRSKGEAYKDRMSAKINSRGGGR